MSDLPPKEMVKRKAAEIVEELETFMRENGVPENYIAHWDDNARTVGISFFISKIASLDVKCQLLMDSMT